MKHFLHFRMVLQKFRYSQTVLHVHFHSYLERFQTSIDQAAVVGRWDNSQC